MEFKALWGVQQCSEEKMIKANVVLEKSHEQIALEAARTYTEVTEYKLCMEDKSRGSTRSPACIALMTLFSELSKLKVEVNLIGVHEHPTYSKLGHMLLRALRHSFYPYAILENEPHPSGKIIAVATTVPTLASLPSPNVPVTTKGVWWSTIPLVNITLVSPIATDKYVNVPVPFYFPLISLRKPLSNIVYNHLSSIDEPRSCIISDKVVRTLDGKTLRIPKSPCEILVAKDASPSERFLVTVATAPNSNKRIVKAVIDGHLIKVIPQGQSSEFQVEVNGAQRSLEQPITIKEGSAESAPVIAKVLKISPNEVKIISETARLSIRTNGVDVEIEASPLYSGLVRGICGRFTGWKKDVLSGPSGEIYRQPAKAIKSYMIPNEQCSRSDIDAAVLLHMSAFPVHGQCLRRLNHLLDKFVGGQWQTCFSLEPVATCAEGCRRVGSKRVEMRFHCFPATSTQAREYMVAYKIRPLTELTHLPVSLTEAITVPETCNKL